MANSSAKGRGVFARAGFRAGELIERVPVIAVPRAQLEFLEKTELSYYSFSWGPEWNDGAIAAGFGGLYNHSYEPNAHFIKLIDDGVIDFVAIRAIARGEEITVNYNGSPEDKTPIWFDGHRWGWYHPDGRRDDSHGP